MFPWRTVCICITFLIAMGLADPDLLKRPSRPSQFGSETQVRKYIEELKEYIRQIPSSRYGKRFAPPVASSVYIPNFYRDNSLKQDFRTMYHSEDYEKHH